METEKVDIKQEIAGENESVLGSREDCFVGADEHTKAEEEFQTAQAKISLRKKFLHIFGIAIIAAMMIGASVTVFFRDKNYQQVSAAVEQLAVAATTPDNQSSAFANDVNGVSLATENLANENDDLKGIAGKSENYFIRDIAIGGGSVMLAIDDEAVPLKVTDIHSDTLMTKDGKKSQVVISWKTNKLAKSEVKYSKDTAGSEKSVKEDGYGFAHAFAVNNLEQSTRYLFTVAASDRSGNTVTSGTLAVFTGTKPISVIDLISSQMGDIFGWAMK